LTQYLPQHSASSLFSDSLTLQLDGLEKMWCGKS